MTQHCAWASAEHGGHPASPLTLANMTDAIDASPNPTQLPSCEPVLESPTSHAKVQELLATDHAVLSLSQVPNTMVQRTKRTFPCPTWGMFLSSRTTPIVTA
jgi:hypothetical protein